MTKTCSKCKLEKPISEFHKDSNCSDGVYPSCKKCRNIKSPNILRKNILNLQGLEECTQCKQILPLKDFNKQRTQCKECQSKNHKEYYIKNKDFILQQMKSNHKKEPWILIYKWINDRCENPKTENYSSYGGRGIQNLFKNSDEIKFLWFRDKAHKLKEPSIDRIDNNGNYCLENCRFIELSLNKRKDKIRPILQLTLDGTLIKEWEAVLDAKKIYGFAIGDCLRGKTKTSKGFIWRYKC